MEGKRAGLALVLSFVVACGGGAPATGGATATAGGGGGAAATSAATSAPTAAGGGGAAATTAAPRPSGPALSSILTAAKVTEYKVTYKLTATGAASAMSGEQSWYLKPPRSRFDFKSNMGGQVTSMSIFDLPEGSYMCFASGGQTQCLGVPPTGSPADQNLGLKFQDNVVENPNGWGGVFVETRSIAGQTAHCYDLKAAAGASGAAAGLSEGRLCWSEKGILLLESFKTSDGTWSMEATQVSTSVPDSDFKLPATPIKFP